MTGRLATRNGAHTTRFVVWETGDDYTIISPVPAEWVDPDEAEAIDNALADAVDAAALIDRLQETALREAEWCAQQSEHASTQGSWETASRYEARRSAWLGVLTEIRGTP